jgi:hypothetical protein
VGISPDGRLPKLSWDSPIARFTWLAAEAGFIILLFQIRGRRFYVGFTIAAGLNFPLGSHVSVHDA